MGQKGGGKGWCGDCLKAEETEKEGLLRDKQGHLCFKCRSCPQTVRVRKYCKNDKRRGTEHLFEKRLCQVCFDLKNV